MNATETTIDHRELTALRNAERQARQKVGHYQRVIGVAIGHLSRLDVPADQRRHLDEAVALLTAARNGRPLWLGDLDDVRAARPKRRLRRVK